MMKIKRATLSAVTVCMFVLAVFAAPASAASKNILGNGGFELPKVPAGYFADFVSGATLGTCGLQMPGSIGYQVGCWRVFGGSVDITSKPYWAAKGGKQALELNGNGPGEILQLFGAAPNTTYHLSFYLSGDPFIAGTVTTLAVQEQFDGAGSYLGGGPIGTYTFDTTGHSVSSMGYKLVTTSFTTGSNTRYADVELQSLTVNNSALWWGPVVDNVTLH
jgi:hypothetical protein